MSDAAEIQEFLPAGKLRRGRPPEAEESAAPLFAELEVLIQLGAAHVDYGDRGPGGNRTLPSGRRNEVGQFQRARANYQCGERRPDGGQLLGKVAGQLRLATGPGHRQHVEHFTQQGLQVQLSRWIDSRGNVQLAGGARRGGTFRPNTGCKTDRGFHPFRCDASASTGCQRST